jgi:hypothetical protein
LELRGGLAAHIDGIQGSEVSVYAAARHAYLIDTGVLQELDPFLAKFIT